jgi:hypothetical protein
MKYKCLIGLLFLTVSLISVSETINNQGYMGRIDGDYDYIVQKQKFELNELRLSLFFDAIRKGNNRYVMMFLEGVETGIIPEIEENITMNNIELLKKNETYKIGVNSKDQFGYSPIIVAIESKNNEILQKLLDLGANIREEHPIFKKLTLHTACYYENLEAVKILIAKDKSLVNEQSGVDGWTPLEDATLKSNTEIVKILLENGANPLISDYTDGTAVDMATEFGKGEIVKLLRDNIKASRK